MTCSPWPVCIWIQTGKQYQQLIINAVLQLYPVYNNNGTKKFSRKNYKITTTKQSKDHS